MSIYAGSNRCDLYKGDYRPATLYQGEQFLAGATDSESVPLPTAVKGTYNDTVALTALGKGKQKTTTGANLFDIDNESLWVAIKCIRENGGIRSNFVDNYYCYFRTADTDFISTVFKPGETFTFSVPENPEGKYVSIVLYGARSDGSNFAGAVHKGTSVTITVPDDFISGITKVELRFNGRTSVFTDTETFFTKLQLEKGDIVTDYEPYTGGKPSPCPDYPQELVASEGTVTTRGNLVDIPDLITKKYYVDMKQYIQWYVGLPVGTTITVSADYYAPYDASGEVSSWKIKLKNAGTIELFNLFSGTPSRKSYTHTKTIDFTMGDVEFSYWYLGYSQNHTLERWAKNITVNIGNKDLGYTKYRPPTSINLPTLRAIPDDNGGWAAQDTLTPVPHMPGWYDLKRQVGTLELDETIKMAYYVNNCFITAKSYTKTPYMMCSHYKALHDIRVATNIPNNCMLLTNPKNGNRFLFKDKRFETAAEIESCFAAEYAAGTPVTIWYILETPTTERIYLGDLKTYPRYTTLNINGDYPPEVSAAMKIQEGGK